MSGSSSRISSRVDHSRSDPDPLLHLNDLTNSLELVFRPDDHYATCLEVGMTACKFLEVLKELEAVHCHSCGHLMTVVLADDRA